MSQDKLLDTCLADIEGGRATAQECMARYPELAPLLELATQLRDSPRPDPSSQFLQATRARLLSLPAQGGNGLLPALPTTRQGSRPRRWLRGLALPRLDLPTFQRRWQPAYVGLVAALVAVFLLGAGSVVASAGALPTSPLYPVKRIVEQTRLLLASDPEQRALLHAEFARRRLDEAVEIAALGRVEQAEQLVEEYGRELEAAVSVAEQAIEQGAAGVQLSDQLLEDVARQRSSVESARDTLPGQAVNQALSAADSAGEELAGFGTEPEPRGILPVQDEPPTSTSAPSRVPAPVVSTPTPYPGFTVKDQLATSIPPRATILPVSLPTSTSAPTTAPPRNTPVIIQLGSPTPEPSAVPSQPPAEDTPRSATPTAPNATEPSQTPVPGPTETQYPATATGVPTNPNTRTPRPTPRQYTPTAVPSATEAATLEPTVVPATPTAPPAESPTVSASSTEPPAPTAPPAESPTASAPATELAPVVQQSTATPGSP